MHIRHFVSEKGGKVETRLLTMYTAFVGQFQGTGVALGRSAATVSSARASFLVVALSTDVVEAMIGEFMVTLSFFALENCDT